MDTEPSRSDRRLPLITIGIVLIAVAVTPTVVGMVGSFSDVAGGVSPSAESLRVWVGRAFHPVFIACGSLGTAFILAGAIRALLPPRAEPPS